ncbi:IS21 family transposase [Aquibacillus albus]|uniref:Transposase n=1 Tax=Aquibacillus albus TaxID=1168171 RepID=A0ABS2N6I5_9BACI|nr:transposase [Aquibacillus albus]
MDKWKVYIQIQQLLEQGFSKATIAKKLGISRGTLYNYLERSPEEMAIWVASTQKRSKKLDVYKDLILSWLREHSDLSSSQVFDWISERYPDFHIGESTVRSYVRELRKEYKIPREKAKRQYEAVPELPMGQQVQVDFGETIQKDAQGKKIKMYFVAFLLSHSRYKYMEWLDRPFTTKDLIEAHTRAFQYFGGIPYEIVYDQDSLIVVSENSGDLILTAEFESYRREKGFHLHVCRKADPESKGKIENVVGFIKKNFSKYRIYSNIDSWNEQALSWLKRTGNGKVHNITKKRPAEVFELEKQHLRPIFEQFSATNTEKQKQNCNPSITRVVRKDNTVLYKSNRYSVPLGTFSPYGTEVNLIIDKSQLTIISNETGEIIAKHDISIERGKLIQDRVHTRDRSKGIDSFIVAVSDKFPDSNKALSYLSEIRKSYPRYIRDQLQLVSKQCDKHDKHIIQEALSACLHMNLYSASEFIDMIEHVKRQRLKYVQAPIDNDHIVQPIRSEQSYILGAKPSQRNINDYISILEGK